MARFIHLYIDGGLAQVYFTELNAAVQQRSQVDSKRNLLGGGQRIIGKRRTAFQFKIAQGKRKLGEAFKKRQSGTRKTELPVQVLVGQLLHFLSDGLREQRRQ